MYLFYELPFNNFPEGVIFFRVRAFASPSMKTIRIHCVHRLYINKLDVPNVNCTVYEDCGLFYIQITRIAVSPSLIQEPIVSMYRVVFPNVLASLPTHY